jgi:hypothetical protein
MIAPIYTITTPTGEECVHLNFFTNLNIERETTIGQQTLIQLKNNSTFWIKESEWISIQREIKINKIIK